MKKYRQQKQKFYFILTLLLVVAIGIGYAVLTETLTISNAAKLNEMKWDIGFANVEDNGSTIDSEYEITNNGKTITVLCDFGSSTNQETCITKATIINNSTFDIGLTSNPTITYDDTYIHTLTFKWNNHPTYENHTVLKDNFIKKGESEEVILTIKNKFFNLENLPTANTTIPITVTLNFIEWKDKEMPETEDLAILKSDAELAGTAFRSEKYNYQGSSGSGSGYYGSSGSGESNSLIKNITFEKGIDVPTNAVEYWDLSSEENGSIIGYVLPNEDDSDYYDLYIQSDKQIYANDDMSYWFAHLYLLESINGLDLIDTSQTTNMSYMFYNAGYDSEELKLDLSSLDTSSVEDMSSMFENAGYYNESFELNISKMDTSNVTDMNNMFNGTGEDNETFTLDVSNFDTSKVTDMSYMFYETGEDSYVFILDVSNFDTSNVENMSHMFYGVGTESTSFSLDVRGFNTGKVTDMSYMFYRVGWNSESFELDLSGFDASRVTDMSYMFYCTGYRSKSLTLNLSNIDASNVTNMSYMFSDAGTYSETVKINLNNFDTSSVTDMSYMFNYTGGYSKTFTLDLSSFDTSNVTDMGGMFFYTGSESETFTLKISNFDTSKVTNMDYMFYSMGGASSKLNTSITIRNPNTSFYEMFGYAITTEGSKITVNYTDETSLLVDEMLETKSYESNVFKGSKV